MVSAVGSFLANFLPLHAREMSKITYFRLLHNIATARLLIESIE